MHETVTKLADEVKALWMATDSLSSFTDWPDDLTASSPAPNPAPAAAKIVAWQMPETSLTSPVCRAVQQAAFHVNWQFIYTKDEVGQHFLDNYAYFELIGPTGHFRSDQCNAFIGYWGPGLFYPAHYHASEELYFVLAGHALFESDGDDPATLGPAAHRFHASHQPHAMTTTNSAILTLVLWRGPELSGLSQLVKADN
jgi:mannose-6-phosphate isomerase-like protein (cupin superfamily)